MAMTREQVLAQMEADYELMSDEMRNGVLYTERGVDWTPALLIEEVRKDTEYGKLYVESWSKNQESKVALTKLLAMLLGGPSPDGEELLTCGDPDCPNCHGEVRPLYGDTGTEPTKH